MFSVTKEYSKTVKSVLSGKEAAQRGKYIIPQFGPAAKKKDEQYSEDEAHDAMQEAATYFGADKLVRFLNKSAVMFAQRRANNDLRATGAGLSDADKLRVQLVLNLAKRAAEMETSAINAKGETIVDTKSAEYQQAFRESIEASLQKPKFADLRPVFSDVQATNVEFDLTTPPGALFGVDDDEEGAAKETE